MSIFVLSTPAPLPKTNRVASIAILYAAFLTVMALGQLYTFDDFIALIGTFELPLPNALTYAIGPVLIACEIGAIPFLLRMRLSPAFRVVSMLLGWIVALIWFLFTLWASISNAPITTVGFLGTVGNLTHGVWAILLSIALGVLAAWASWGMWPFITKKSKRKK